MYNGASYDFLHSDPQVLLDTKLIPGQLLTVLTKEKKKSNCPKLLIITKLHVFVFFRTKAFYCILHHHSNLGINRIH